MFTTGLKEELSKSIKDRVMAHKVRFIKLFYGRYKELLPSLIVYENYNTTSIDFLKLETALRNGYDMVIGETVDKEITLLGYTNERLSSENAAVLFNETSLTKKDINFIIPSDKIKKDMKEISFKDDCKTGEFIVLRNKTHNYVSDDEILRHYIDELAELVLSRYSISMQSKIHTFFMSDVNDETINQIIDDLYNGSPYIKVSKLFDVNDNIHALNNEHLATAFMELKREYQNKISELNNMLGINSLAVEKSSGVSDVEAKSNRAFTTSNSNIYLSARNSSLVKLNKRFDLELKAIYNDDVTSEINSLGGDFLDDNNNNVIPDDTNGINQKGS